MKASIKHHVIYRHRTEYPVCRMCRFFEVSRSGYYDYVRRLGKPERDAELADIIAAQRECSLRTYGYRRMWLWLERQAIHRNPKIVLRVVKKYHLLSEFRRRRKWIQMGLHKYENLMKRFSRRQA